MYDLEVLRLALSKEEAAIKMYEKLIGTNPKLKDLLYFLLNEEQKHREMIKNKIVELENK